MGQILHGSATTTHAVRAAIQRSKASIQELSERYGMNPKTVDEVAEARLRRGCADGAEGSALDGAVAEEEAARRRLPQAHAVAARRLPLCPPGHHPASDPFCPCTAVPAPRHQPPAERRRRQAAPRSSRPIPSATSTSISPRCAPRRASSTSSWPSTDVSKFAFAELHERATGAIAADFLRGLIEAVPYKIHTVLTDNGTHFTTPGAGVWQPRTSRRMSRARDLPRPRLRPGLRPARHRASPDQTQSSVDQWPGRADEPHDQGSHRAPLLLRQP